MQLTKKEYALDMDSKDELAYLKEEFYMQPDSIYMDGNSLGLMSKRAEASAVKLLNSWKKYGIDGWEKGNNPWFFLSEQLSKEMAPLVGGKPEEVIVTGSTTVNLHQVLTSFYKPDEHRYKIVGDELNFPTDIYAIKSHLESHNLDVDSHLKLVKSRDGNFITEDDIMDSFAKDVSMVILPSVLYRSGQLLDIKRITEAAHKLGILVTFDLSHSAGAIPHELSNWNVDFAFWCTYKHLNGGPGSVGALYVNEKHFGIKPGLAGWFGSDKNKQFNLDLDMTASNNVGAYQIGTPHVLNLAPLIGSLSIFKEVGIDKIREKSLLLTEYLVNLVEEELQEEGFIISNPLGDLARGGHVYLEHKEAARICKALKSVGVVPDFRAPSGIRLAPVALYNSYLDVWEAVQRLKKIMEKKSYMDFKNERGTIA